MSKNEINDLKLSIIGPLERFATLLADSGSFAHAWDPHEYGEILLMLVEGAKARFNEFAQQLDDDNEQGSRCRVVAIGR